MKCQCGSENHSVTHTSNQGNRPLPAELRGLNIIRRRRYCHNCHDVFHTIELFERDFERLKKPPEIEGPEQSLRQSKVRKDG